MPVSFVAPFTAWEKTPYELSWWCFSLPKLPRASSRAGRVTLARNFLYIGFGFSDLDWEVVVVEAVRTAVVKQRCW
jgi:hypothetical protein